MRVERAVLRIFALNYPEWAGFPFGVKLLFGGILPELLPIAWEIAEGPSDPG